MNRCEQQKSLFVAIRKMCITVLVLLVALAVSSAYDQPSQSHDSKADDKGSAQCGSAQCGCMYGPGGSPGVPGVPGMNGWRGDDGPKGVKGDRGDTGNHGFPGEIGPPGPVGPPAVRGRRGYPGEPGGSGDPGRTGVRGDRGFPGMTGVKGSKGDPAPKPKRIAFSVFRSQKLGPVLEPTAITFDKVFTNLGGAFDERTSHFIGNTNGTYLFTAHILGQDEKDAHAWIMFNTRHQVPIHADNRAGHGTGSQTVILHLAQDDHVWLQLGDMSGLMNDFTTFSGYLLYEDDPAPQNEELSNYLETNNFNDYWSKWKK